MGLIKAMDTKFGVQVNYWNIGSLAFDKRANTVHALLYGYVSQKARLAGALPLMTREFDFPATGTGAAVIDPTGTDPLAAAYTILTKVVVTTTTMGPMTGTATEETVEAPFSPEFYGAPAA